MLDIILEVLIDFSTGSDEMATTLGSGNVEGEVKLVVPIFIPLRVDETASINSKVLHELPPRNIINLSPSLRCVYEAFLFGRRRRLLVRGCKGRVRLGRSCRLRCRLCAHGKIKHDRPEVYIFCLCKTSFMCGPTWI